MIVLSLSIDDRYASEMPSVSVSMTGWYFSSPYA